MKILLDENISRRIIPLIHPSFGEVEYIRSPRVGLNQPISDHTVWKFAKENNFHILTRDEDFIKLSLLFGAPPKVILLNSGNTTNQQLADILIHNVEKIRQFIDHEEFGFLILKR